MEIPIEIEDDTITDMVVNNRLFEDAVKDIIDENVDTSGCDCDDYSDEIEDIKEKLEKINLETASTADDHHNRISELREEIDTLNKFTEQTNSCYASVNHKINKVQEWADEHSKRQAALLKTAEEISERIEIYVKLKNSFVGKILTFFGMM